MSQSKKSRRQKSRSSDSPMPMGGAGLIRFYQDQSNGIKVSPTTTIVLSIILLAIVFMAHAGWLPFLLGSD